MKSAMTAILRDASGKMHHGILFDRRLPDFDRYIRLEVQEPKPILRYALVECLNVWINEGWENFELYHMKNNAAENHY